MESSRLPPLVFKLNSHKPEQICHGIDVVRCRKNALAHASFEAVEQRGPLRPSSSAAIGTLGLDSEDPDFPSRP